MSQPVEQVKKQRKGRPRKHPLPEDDGIEEPDLTSLRADPHKETEKVFADVMDEDLNAPQTLFEVSKEAAEQNQSSANNTNRLGMMSMRARNQKSSKDHK